MIEEESFIASTYYSIMYQLEQGWAIFSPKGHIGTWVSRGGPGQPCELSYAH